MGNGFPGLAIVSLVALLVALAVAILVALQPWAPASVAPRLELALGIGVALGDATPVASGQAFAVAPSRPTRGGGRAVAATEASTVGGGSRPVSGLAPAQAVAQPVPALPVEAAPETPQPASPGPASLPVAEPEQSPPPSEPVPVAAPVEPSPQPVAAVPKGSLGLGDTPQTAGMGEAGGGVEGETPEGEEEGEAREDECTPPFTLFFEGVRHEVAICFEAVGGEGGLYLLLDGELIDIDTWGGRPAMDEPEGAEPALP